MDILNIKSKALKRLILRDDASLLPSQYVRKIRMLISLLKNAKDIQEFLEIEKGNPHPLKGDRAGDYAISVYANWRLTFRYDRDENAIEILDFEDYH